MTLIVGGQRITETFGRGENTFVWSPDDVGPGTYHPYLTAVGPGGPARRDGRPAGDGRALRPGRRRSR